VRGKEKMVTKITSTIGMTSKMIIPITLIDTRLEIIARAGMTLVNLVMTLHQVGLTNLKVLLPHHLHHQMKIEAVNETVNREVKVVIIVTRLTTEIVANSNNEMMMVLLNHQTQVMTIATDNHIDHPIGNVGEINIDTRTKGPDITVQDLREHMDLPTRDHITLETPRSIVRM
jgi:hypothetical protein